MPLRYDPNRVVVIAAQGLGPFEEECRVYNVDPAAPGFHVVYTAADVTVALALPVETPWTVVGEVAGGIRDGLKRRFGASKRFPDAVIVLEVDIAWPKPMVDRI